MFRLKRIPLHILFWLVYFSVNLFNELLLSSSFNAHPSTELAVDAVLAQLLILIIKIPAVYYVLYSLIPRWLNDQYKLRLFIEASFVFFILLIIYRMIIQLIIWPYIYHNPPVILSPLQLTARFFYSFMDLMQVVGIASAIKLFRLRIKAMRNEKMLVQEKLQSEMLHLKSQINPHFLFNTLNSIYSLSRSQSVHTADSVMRLSNILRYMLYETGKKTSSIKDELKIIDDYIELQQLRFGDKLKVNIHKEIDQSSAQVAPLLILPLIENAFKHGIGNTEEDIIHIHIRVKDHQLMVEIRNALVERPTGIGYEKEHGIGLQNIRRQLQLLYKSYTFEHKENKGNFMVNLTIDLSSYAGFELFDSRR
jgi:two-component system, LytTR family, sensor kinase